MNRKAFLITAVVAVLGAVVATFLASGRASVYVFFGTVALWTFVLIPAVLALVILLLARWRAERRRVLLERLAGADVGFLLFVLLLVPAYLAGVRIADWRVERAKERARETVSALEVYRERFGRYPEELAEASEAGITVPGPALVRESAYYATHDGGETFELHLPDPAAFLFGGWSYSSELGRWYYDD